jgi:hypothetical protein
MNQVSHISCPACRAAVGVTNLDRVLNCAYCNARLLVENPAYQAQYYVASELTAVDARRVLQKFLTRRFLPGGLLRHARFHEARLCYVPFYEYRTRRLGTIETSLEKTSRTSLEIDGSGAITMGTTFSERKKKTSIRETELVIGDICRIESATRLKQFGLDVCGVADYLRGTPVLHPFENGVHLKDARVYPPTVSADAMAAQLTEGGGYSASVTDNTRFVESRIQIVYYPLWRMTYRFRGRLYTAVVDGVLGKLLRVTAPEGDQLRVATLLVGVTFLGGIGGSIAKSLTVDRALAGASLLFRSHIGVPLLLVLGIFLVALIGVWFLVWSQFRWPGEVRMEGDDIHVEKYNGLLRRRIQLPLLTPETLLKILFQKGT